MVAPLVALHRCGSQKTPPQNQDGKDEELITVTVSEKLTLNQTSVKLIEGGGAFTIVTNKPEVEVLSLSSTDYFTLETTINNLKKEL